MNLGNEIKVELFFSNYFFKKDDFKFLFFRKIYAAVSSIESLIPVAVAQLYVSVWQVRNSINIFLLFLVWKKYNNSFYKYIFFGKLGNK